MDPVLQSLIRYQELFMESTRQAARLQQFPPQIKAIDDHLEASSASLIAARAALTDHQKDKRKLEAELQDLESKLKKYNDQLMQVKTNNEYKAMQTEIEGVKAKVIGVEEKILELIYSAEAAERRVKDEEKALELQRKDAEARKSVVRAEEQQVKQEASAAETAFNEARAMLANDVLELFNRIAKTRNGIAVARAREERCQECNVRIRPQIFQEIRRNERIIQCDSCLRILYFVPEAPAPDAVQPE